MPSSGVDEGLVQAQLLRLPSQQGRRRRTREGDDASVSSGSERSFSSTRSFSVSSSMATVRGRSRAPTVTAVPAQLQDNIDQAFLIDKLLVDKILNKQTQRQQQQRQQRQPRPGGGRQSGVAVVEDVSGEHSVEFSAENMDDPDEANLQITDERFSGLSYV